MRKTDNNRVDRLARHQDTNVDVVQVTDSPLLMLQSLTVGTVKLRMKTRNVAHVKVMMMMIAIMIIMVLAMLLLLMMMMAKSKKMMIWQ